MSTVSRSTLGLRPTTRIRSRWCSGEVFMSSDLLSERFGTNCGVRLIGFEVGAVGGVRVLSRVGGGQRDECRGGGEGGSCDQRVPDARGAGVEHGGAGGEQMVYTGRPHCREDRQPESSTDLLGGIEDGGRETCSARFNAGVR